MADVMNPGVFSPEFKNLYGYTFAQWSEKWWQWLLSIPAPQNPGSDTSGRYCAIGQTNPNISLLLVQAPEHTFVHVVCRKGDTLFSPLAMNVPLPRTQR